MRAYFRKLYESDFGFWGFGILGDFAGGCESGRSSTFLEPRSTPGSFTYSPRVSSCKVNISGMVIFFDEANCSRFDIQMFNRGEQHELSFVGSVVQVRNIPIIKVDSKLYGKSHRHSTFKIPPILILLAQKVLLEDL